MSSNVVNQVAYLRTSREFPEDDAHELSVEINKCYIDIANAVNRRTISLFPTTRPAATGENWFLTKNQRQQGFREVYTFTTLPATIPHGIDLSKIYGFVRIFGAMTDGSFWYTLPWVSVVAANNQINVFISSTNIQITGGGGAQQPVITAGTVVLEWISEV